MSGLETPTKCSQNYCHQVEKVKIYRETSATTNLHAILLWDGVAWMPSG